MVLQSTIQNIDIIPQDLKELYRTVWEMSMKDIIDMSRHRGYFIDQSQSLNLFMEGATMAKLTSMHFYAWKSGLKTGMYYLRTKSAVDAIKFTLKTEKKEGVQSEKVAVAAAQVMEAQSTTAKPAKQEAVVPESTALTPEELRDIIARSKESEGDDCLMCGS